MLLSRDGYYQAKNNKAKQIDFKYIDAGGIPTLRKGVYYVCLLPILREKGIQILEVA